MNNMDRLVHITQNLTPYKVKALIMMADALQRNIDVSIDRNSDILSESFVEAFSTILLMHHATHIEKFNKKSFEYAFVLASREAGKVAGIEVNSTYRGADAWVAGVNFSLKTEASRRIRQDTIVISKLMEAHWIRDCITAADFRQGVMTNVVGHLRECQRILTLRAFDVADGVRYDLVEIPLDLLLRIGTLTEAAFGPRKMNGGSRADIMVDGRRAFTINLDGSVEKVQILNLATNLCHTHGSWTIEHAVIRDDEPNE